MLQRLITKQLIHWKDNSKNAAFILEGVKHTGKTYILDWFCKNYFSDYLYINLSTDKKALEYLRACKSAGEYLSVFNVLSPLDKVKEGTVIFIDDIHLHINTLTFLKPLSIDGRYRYLVAGSSLTLGYGQVTSLPLGYAQFHTLYPLNFHEYLLASNISEDTIQEVANNIKYFKEINPLYFNIFSEVFDKYLLTGGYPLVVQDYLDNQDLTSLFDKLKAINNCNQEEFSNYDKLNNKLMTKELYNNIPIQLNKESNSFLLNDFIEGIKYLRVERTISNLTIAGYAYRVDQSNSLKSGFNSPSKDSFKLYLNDAGILGSTYGESYQMGVFSKSKDINFNPLYENFVCTELAVHDYRLYYYKTDESNEFLFGYYNLKRSMTIPMQVILGKNYEEHKTLDYVLNKYKHFKYGFVLTNSNIKAVDKIIYLPIWAIGLYPKLKESDFIKESSSLKS